MFFIIKCFGGVHQSPQDYGRERKTPCADLYFGSRKNTKTQKLPTIYWAAYIRMNSVWVNYAECLSACTVSKIPTQFGSEVGLD